MRIKVPYLSNQILDKSHGYIFVIAVAIFLLTTGFYQDNVRSVESGNISNSFNLIKGEAAQVANVETSETDTVNLQNGLQRYYRFDGAGIPQGQSIEFDGTDDFVDVSAEYYSIDQYNFTLSAWVNADRIDGQHHDNVSGIVIGQNYGSQMAFGLDEHGKLMLNMDDTRSGTPVSTNSLEEDRWYHIAVTYEYPSNLTRYYINGKRDPNSPYYIDDGNGVVDSNDMFIGKEERYSMYFDGAIADPRIYNNSLSGQEIRNLHEEKLFSEENLILDLNFNQNREICNLALTNNCLEDESEEDNDGDPKNFDDNDFNTGSGWYDQSPLNRPLYYSSSDKGRTRFYGGSEGYLNNFEFDSTSGWTTGVVGHSGLNFDGNDDYVEIRHDKSLNFGTEDFAVSTWVKNSQSLETRDDIYGIGHKGSENNEPSWGFWLRGGTYNGLVLRIGTTDGVQDITPDSSYTDTLSDGGWHHLVYSRKDGIGKLFIDGKKVAESVSDSDVSNQRNQVIGVGRDTNSIEFNGSIDDFRIYDSGLKSSQVDALYNNREVREGLVGEWRFEEGTGEIVYDTSNLARSGILGTEAPKFWGNSSFSDSTYLDYNNEVAVSAWYKTDSLKFGDGSDGNVEITTEKEIDSNLKSNGRAYPDGVNYAVKGYGSDYINTFSTPNGISSDDKLLLINLQGTASNYKKVGKYQFLRAEDLNYTNNRIFLEDRITKELGTPVYQNIVVQRVPEYSTLKVDGGELTASDWSSASLETCPDGWNNHNGECYRQTGSDYWSNVRSNCRNYGGELVRIENSTENEFIQNNFPDSWIGFRDISGPDHGGTDSPYEWVWTFGDYYSYKNFSSGEPSIGGVDHNPTVRIDSTGGWHTEFGHNNTYPGVCEMNKKKGGLVSLEVSQYLETVNGGVINTTGKGYRGGDCTYCGDDADGRAGEGVGGTGKYGFYGEVNNINGGAGAYVNNNDGGDPAGGGGYGASGEDSSNGHEGGEEIGEPKLGKLYYGGGGGTGSDNDYGTPYPEDSHGAGIIHIMANEVKNLEVYSRGINGKTDCGQSWAAQGGGGAGGTIYIGSKKVEISKANASGGSGIYDGEDGPDNNECLSGERSGDGGQGRIRINYIDHQIQEVQPNPYNTSLIPNLVRKKGEFGIGGYRDVAYGSINNKSSAVDRLSDKDEWRNIVLDFDGSTGNLFLDGKKVGSFERSSITKTGKPLTMAESFRGKLDEVRIYNRTLNEKEAARLAFK